MAEPALQSCYKAIAAQLRSDGSEIWGTKVRASIVKPNTPYPYAVYFWSGGGENNSIRGDDAEFRITVKVVSDKLAEAMAGKQRISALLNNRGEQAVTTGFLAGGADWKILTSTEEDTVYIAEFVSDTLTIYHVGAIFRIALQET
jgi:hypothetical protein